jgi:hypothetical protein
MSILLNISIADRDFGTKRFCPLFPKFVNKRVYSTVKISRSLNFVIIKGNTPNVYCVTDVN